jgi:hypothetical protein
MNGMAELRVGNVGNVGNVRQQQQQPPPRNNNNNNKGLRAKKSNRPAPLQLNAPPSTNQLFHNDRRGATALTSELEQLGLSNGRKNAPRTFQTNGGRIMGQQQQQQQAWSPRNNGGNGGNGGIRSPRNGNMNNRNMNQGNRQPRKLLEIKEISSFQYGAHGQLVPVGNMGNMGNDGPGSPLSRHIHMQEMRQMELSNNVSPAPIVEGRIRRQREAFTNGKNTLRQMDIAERNLLNDINSLDYALEANKRKQLRSTRSEPNREPRRAPLVATQRRNVRSQRQPHRTRNYPLVQQQQRRQQQQQQPKQWRGAQRRQQQPLQSPRRQQQQQQQGFRQQQQQPRHQQRQQQQPRHQQRQQQQQQQQQQPRQPRQNRGMASPRRVDRMVVKRNVQQQQQQQQKPVNQPWGGNYFQAQGKNRKRGY